MFSDDKTPVFKGIAATPFCILSRDNAKGQKVEHILILSGRKTTPVFAESKERAGEIIEELKKPENMAALKKLKSILKDSDAKPAN